MMVVCPLPRPPSLVPMGRSIIITTTTTMMRREAPPLMWTTPAEASDWSRQVTWPEYWPLIGHSIWGLWPAQLYHLLHSTSSLEPPELKMMPFYDIIIPSHLRLINRLVFYVCTISSEINIVCTSLINRLRSMIRSMTNNVQQVQNGIITWDK